MRFLVLREADPFDFEAASRGRQRIGMSKTSSLVVRALVAWRPNLVTLVSEGDSPGAEWWYHWTGFLEAGWLPRWCVSVSQWRVTRLDVGSIHQRQFRRASRGGGTTSWVQGFIDPRFRFEASLLLDLNSSDEEDSALVEVEQLPGRSVRLNAASLFLHSASFQGWWLVVPAPVEDPQLQSSYSNVDFTTLHFKIFHTILQNSERHAKPFSRLLKRCNYCNTLEVCYCFKNLMQHLRHTGNVAFPDWENSRHKQRAHCNLQYNADEVRVSAAVLQNFFPCGCSNSLSAWNADKYCPTDRYFREFFFFSRINKNRIIFLCRIFLRIFFVSTIFWSGK